ncbi:murein biosynthesis integral membrane protein MurJ [Gallicola sp. Sow4_E12]|uniref:murein biosynthesis integral membrane protein MurJ n=1 Tax=Gallicola sp. Sow4_E12 TaxID=3438785 RepID=UPI003F91189F
MGITGIVLIIIQAVSMIFGFIRELTLSNYYGISSISDAFLIVSNLPFSIFYIISSAISISFIPTYNKIKKIKGSKEAENFTSNIVNIIFVFAIIFSILIIIFSKPIVKIFAVGFDDQTLNLAVYLLRISVFSLVFVGIVGVFVPYLNSNKEFIIPAMIGLPFNIGIIGGIILSSYISVYFLGAGTIVGYALQFLALIPCLIKVGYSHKRIIRPNDSTIKQMLVLSIPITIGVSAEQINYIIDRTIASTLQVGGISALNYAVRLNGFAQNLIVYPVTTLFYPIIAELVVNKNYNNLNKIIHKSLSVITLLMVPIIIGGFILSKEIISILFLRGAFDENALIMTEGALKFYMIGTAGIAYREVYSRVFYSFNDTITPVKNMIITVFINIILNLTLSKVLGISGLAFATSISSIIAAGLLKKDLKIHLRCSNDSRNLLINQIKIIFAGLLMGVGIILYQYLRTPENNIQQLIIQISIGALIFSFMVLILRVEELEDVKNILYRMKNKISKYRDV